MKVCAHPTTLRLLYTPLTLCRQWLSGTARPRTSSSPGNQNRPPSGCRAAVTSASTCSAQATQPLANRPLLVRQLLMTWVGAQALVHIWSGPAAVAAAVSVANGWAGHGRWPPAPVSVPPGAGCHTSVAVKAHRLTSAGGGVHLRTAMPAATMTIACVRAPLCSKGRSGLAAAAGHQFRGLAGCGRQAWLATCCGGALALLCRAAGAACGMVARLHAALR